MQKRGQIISFDLVLGMLIFIIAAIFLLIQIDKLIPESADDLNIQSDFVFNNLELNLKNPKYASSTGNKGFLDNYKISEEELKKFQNLPYEDSDENDFNDIKSLAIKNLQFTGLIVDFCIFFENKDSNLIEINGKSGIGKNNANEKIFVGKNINGQIGCNENMEDNTIAFPECSDFYSNAIKIFKPVVRQNQIMKMNILLCGK